MLGTPIFGDAPPISTVLNARLNRQPNYRAGERPGAECLADAGNRAPAATELETVRGHSAGIRLSY